MRQLIIVVVLFLSTMLHAQTRWCIVDADNPDVPLAQMGNVAYLLTNDYDNDLCLVCKDGTVCPKLTTISFRQFDQTAIRPAQTGAEPQVVMVNAGRTLTISGCQAGLPIHIYNMSGSELVSLTTTEASTQVAVGHLPVGIYLLQVGSTTVKFQKR